MFVCLYVCIYVLYAFRHRTSQCIHTFQEPASCPGEGQRLLFVEKKIGPPPAKGQPVYLTNQIATFNSIGKFLNSTF
jgi:hypothetical protein